MQRTSPIRAFLAPFAFVSLALITAATLNACNTTEGVGEDIEATGDAIADTARDAKD
jgi:predicted small secreted protein